MRSEKAFLLDTNIILDNADNFKTLAENGKNIIILVSTVLDELDTFKKGFDEINYEARKFNRLLSDAKIISRGEINNSTFRIEKQLGEVTIHLITLKKHNSNEYNTDKSILNDTRIIESAESLTKEYSNLTLVSNDIGFRIRALAKNLNVQVLHKNDKTIDDMKFGIDIKIKEDAPQAITVEKVEEYLGEALNPETVYITFQNIETGNFFISVKEGNTFYLLNENELNAQLGIPKNLEQKVYSKLLLTETYTIVVTNSRAGCVLPGTDINVEVKDVWVSSKEVQKTFNINSNDLIRLRRHKLIEYRKNKKGCEYNLASLRKYSLRFLEINSGSKLIFHNDKKFTSKYLQLRYWLNTNISVKEAIEKVTFLRYYKNYFDVDRKYFQDKQFNMVNLEKTVAKIRFKLLSFKYKSIKELEGFSYSQWVEDFWTFRGYSIEEAMKKVSERQSAFTLKKCIQKHGKEEGTKVWKERQIKWQKTLQSREDYDTDAYKKEQEILETFSEYRVKLPFTTFTTEAFSINVLKDTYEY